MGRKSPSIELGMMLLLLEVSELTDGVYRSIRTLGRTTEGPQYSLVRGKAGLDISRSPGSLGGGLNLYNIFLAIIWAAKQQTRLP